MSRITDRTTAWEWAGLAAAAVIVLALPLYHFLQTDGAGRETVAAQPATFVGSAECRDCHHPRESRRASHTPS